MNHFTSVGEHMARYPLITDKTMPVKHAYEFMQDCGIRHLPVIEEQRLVGVVSERDLRYAMGLSEFGVLRVEDVMTCDPYSVTSGTSLAEVAQTMADNKYGCAVVVSSKGQVVGIFTTTDAMKVLAQLLHSDGGQSLRMMTIEEFTFPMLNQ